MHTNKITRTLISATLVIASISGCYATFAGDVITFTDAPTAIAIEAGSQASFNVTLRNSGDLYADVRINARLPLPDGISFVSSNEDQLVDMGKSVDYRIVIAAGEDMASGTYPIEIADESSVDRRTWHTIDLNVTGRSVATPEATESGREEVPGEEEKRSPGFGFVTAVAAMAAAYHSRSP